MMALFTHSVNIFIGVGCDTIKTFTEWVAVGKLDYFEAKLDDKNRLTIPTDLEPEFRGEAVLTFGFGEYLHLYSSRVWAEEVEPALYGGSIFDEAQADYAAKIRRGKTEQELDQKQGRLLIKKPLLEYAGIKKEVVATRVGSYWRLAPKV